MENLFNDIANAGSLTEYAPRLNIGDHVLALNLYDTMPTRQKGTLVFAEFVVVESTSHRPGEVVGDAWFVGLSGDPGLYARKRALKFGETVVECLNGDPGNTPLVQQTLAQISDKVRQPGRGLLVRCTTRKEKRTNKAGQTGEFVNNSYSKIDGQTPETIGQRRAWCEQVAPVKPRTAQQPAQQYAQPAPMPQTYAAPPVQTQPAPVTPGVAPGMGGLLGNFGIK